jgi:hypothetical protein
VHLRTDAWVPTVAATGVLIATSAVGYSAQLRLPTTDQSRRVLAVPVSAGAVGYVEIGGVVMGSDRDRPGELDDTSDDDVRAYVSRLWAEDWDSAEDSVYDDVR